MSCLDKEIYDYTQVANLMRSHGMDFATIEKCLDFIRAEARAEALREAADRAVKFCHVIFPWGSDGSYAENLRAAITQEPQP